MHAIKACMAEDLDRNYRNRNICILSDSQAATKDSGNHKSPSELVWDCHQSLKQLDERDRVQLIWMPGHESIACKERKTIWTTWNLNVRSYYLNQLAASGLFCQKNEEAANIKEEPATLGGKATHRTLSLKRTP
jgi:hypothetical protein